MSKVTVQIRRKGVITLPIELRKRYGLNEGDVFTLEDLGDGSFLLLPRVSQVASLGDRVAQMMEEEGGGQHKRDTEDTRKIPRALPAYREALRSTGKLFLSNENNACYGTDAQSFAQLIESYADRLAGPLESKERRSGCLRKGLHTDFAQVHLPPFAVDGCVGAIPHNVVL